MMEAEFAMDEKSALSLFDCLTPTLKEHRQFKPNLNYTFCLDDFREQKRVKQIEWDLQQSRFPEIVEENKVLKATN